MSKKMNISDNVLDEMITDILLRLCTLEKVLMDKGIFMKEEFHNEMNGIAAKVAKTILEKANVSGDLDEIISNLQKESKKVVIGN